MSSRRDVLRLAELLASAPTVSYREHEVFARIRSELDRYGISYATDSWGNLLARYRGRRARGRPVAFTAHADHPGLIITACHRLRAEARWLGGVQVRYFRGSRVRIETKEGPVRGRVLGTVLGPNKRVAAVKLDVKRPVPVGSIGGWDLVPYRLDPPWIRTKSADDLLGCAGVLALMKELVATQPRIEVWAAFTRAEEDGLLGATALAEAGTLPKETAIVVLETSKQLACGQLGRGVIVRVGDRMSVYDPEISQGLHDAAEELTKKHRSFRYQRCLMDGGVCEATAFQSFGYRAGGLALPLDNYHNMGKRAIREEIVHQDDYWNLARLLPVAAGKIAEAKDGLAGLRERFRKRLKAARPEMVRTRGFGPAPGTSRMTRGKRLTVALAFCLFAAGSGLSAPQIEDGEFEKRPITKPTVLSSSPSASRSHQTDPRDDYDALHYDLFLSLDLENETISGQVTMRLSAKEDLAAILLDLDESLVVDSVACGSRTCPYSRPTPNELEIVPSSPITGGTIETLVVRYEGTPGTAYFSGFKFFAKHGQEPNQIPMASSLSQPDRARGWWPCKDVMDDKATASVTVETPEDFVVAGNGNRTRDVVESGVHRTTWATTYPIATYLVSFAATNYTSWQETYFSADGDSIPLLFYAYPEDEADARIDFAITGEALAVLEGIFGPYPFRNRSIGWEKLGIAEFAWPSGAMEHQTCISYGDGLVDGTHGSDWIIVHEIAHQWWGDSVTPTSMDHIWLNEGFATYSEALFAEAKEGPTGYRQWMRRLWKSPRSEFDGTIVRPMSWFNATVYRKAAWTLHMLRGVLRGLHGEERGDELFFEALNAYHDRYRYANASTRDFMRAVEETVHRDLRWFFHPWLYGTGRPHLAWDWETTTQDGGYAIRLFVRQTQEEPAYPQETPTGAPPTFFSFPLQVRVFGAGDSLDRSVFVDQRWMAATIDGIPFEPDSIALDPDEWILRELAPRGTRLPASQVQVVPNPSVGRVQLLVNHPGPERAELSIHDIIGRKVRSLPSIQGAGVHEIAWDGRNDSGEIVGSGLYLLRVTGPSSAQSARIMIAR